MLDTSNKTSLFLSHTSLLKLYNTLCKISYLKKIIQTNFKPALFPRSKQVNNEWSHIERWLVEQAWP